MDLFEHQSQAFKTSLEVARLQFTLGKMEAGEELDEAKKEITEKLDELKSQFKETQELALKNIQDWQQDSIKGMEKFQEWTKTFLNRKA
jgi:hypothetical protein